MPDHSAGAYRRTGPLARAAAAGLTMLGVLGGFPFALLALHGTSHFARVAAVVAHPGRLGLVLAAGLTIDRVVTLLWLLGSLAWAWFAWSLATELAVRTLGARRPRRADPRVTRRLVAYLVGATLFVGATGRVAPLRLGTTGTLAGTTSVIPGSLGSVALAGSPGDLPEPVPGPIGAAEVSDAGHFPAASDVSSGRFYVVQPHDTLWSIAERELGSPLLWRSIATLNYGRRQPDGGALTDDHWIRPGWVFALPGPAAPVAPEAATPTTTADAAAPPRSPLDVVQLETAGAEERAARRHSLSAQAGGSESGGRSRDPVAAGTPRQTHAEDGTAGRGAVPVAPIGYGLLGAGIVAVLDRMRRAQQRRRPTGLRIALPQGDLAELERGLRLSADQDSVDLIDLSLRLLALQVRRAGVAPPAIRAVRLVEGGIEIVLESTRTSVVVPPDPFSPGPDTSTWRLAWTAGLSDSLHRDSAVRGHDAPLPSLVTLGRDARGLLLVNLECAGSVSVEGDESDHLVQCIAVELATAAWADQIELFLVGLGATDPRLDRVGSVESLESIASHLERRSRERRALLAMARRNSNWETRWLEEGDAWDVCVVVCSGQAAAAERDQAEAICSIVGDGSLGVAFVCGAGIERARWQVRAENGAVAVEGFEPGLPHLSSQTVPPDLVQQVSSLVSVAAVTEGVDSSARPYDTLALATPDRGVVGPGDQVSRERIETAPPRGPESPVEGPEVDVRVLGPLEIIGAARQFTRAWAVELVVYLSVHPGGVATEQWATALWPEKIMAPASLHSTASAARRSLGVARSGEDHLPRSRGRLALGPTVGSDWEKFVKLSRSDDPGSWAEALGLIRGRPFEGLRATDWALLEGIQATIEAVVVDVACRCAERSLDLGEAKTAEWAARQALRVSPYDERLYRILMRAADAAGNPAGVEAIMAELVHLVADDVEPYDAVHPETLALYRHLSRRTLSPKRR